MQSAGITLTAKEIRVMVSTIAVSDVCYDDIPKKRIEVIGVAPT